MSNKLTSSEIIEVLLKDEDYLLNLLYLVKEKRYLWYQKDKGYFKNLDPTEGELETKLFYYITDYLNQSKVQYTQSQIKGHILDHLRSRLPLYETSDIYDSVAPNYHKYNYIAVDDKVINLATLDFEEPSPEKRALHYIPVASEDVTTNNCPRFKKFLDEVLVNENHEPDTQLIDLMQWIFGYSLLNTTKGDVAFFFVGEGNNGKSIMADILGELFPYEMRASETIETLTTDKFSTSLLIGKKINICHEDESERIAAGKFKALVTGNPVKAERKFQNAFIFYPKVKFVFCTNNIPEFKKVDHGLMRRVVIIPFKKILKPKEVDTQIFHKLRNELPGILAWALEGTRRIIDSGHFLPPAAGSSSDYLKEFTASISNVSLFYQDNLKRDDKTFYSNTKLYRLYKSWCGYSNRGAKTDRNFVTEMSRINFADQPHADRKYVGGKQVRGRMVKLSDESSLSLFCDDEDLQPDTIDIDFENPESNPF